MVNDLNIVWRLINNEPEYRYNDSDEWIKLLDTPDKGLATSVLVQILKDENITNEQADIMFKFIDSNRLLIGVLMKIDGLLSGHSFRIGTHKEMLKSSLLKTILKSPKIIKILNKSLYMINIIFNKMPYSGLFKCDTFVITTIDNYFLYFVDERDLFNDLELLYFLGMDKINELLDQFKHDEAFYMELIRKINLSKFALDFFSQEKYLKIDMEIELYSDKID